MFQKVEYDKEYAKKNYDEIELNSVKGTRQLLKVLAENKGISVNQLVIGAVEKKFRLDIAPNKKQNNNT